MPGVGWAARTANSCTHFRPRRGKDYVQGTRVGAMVRDPALQKGVFKKLMFRLFWSAGRRIEGIRAWEYTTLKPEKFAYRQWGSRGATLPLQGRCKRLHILNGVGLALTQNAE